MFAGMSEWGIIIGIAGAVAACIMFVVKQGDEIRKDLGGKIDNIRKDITRVEDESTRKIASVHVRIDNNEDNSKTIERNIVNHLHKMKDDITQVYKELWNRSK